jgi:hypothetical protein
MEYGPWEKSQDLDEWMEAPRREGELTPFCSFCGSLNPAKFLDLIRQGWSVGPTDKNYKAYLSRTSESPAGEDARPTRHVQSKFYYVHLSPEQQREFIDLYNSGAMSIGLPGYFYAPPFFMRFAAPPEE